MSNTYLYDGTFSSLLALISILLTFNNNPDNIKSEIDYIPNLLDMPVKLNLGNIEEKVHLLEKKLSLKILHTCYYVYLGADDRKELVIYYFIKNAHKYNNEIYRHRNLNCVNEAIRISNMVSHEAHKLKGFLRFKEMKNNFYYGQLSPTNNVIEILANHFKKRLSSEKWIIKDVNRCIYAVYDLNKVIYLTDEDIININLELSNKEEDFEELWKTFFKTISIKERKNLKVQRNFMPKKYWNYLIEMDDENEKSN